MVDTRYEPLRADALRNREHILQIANDAFSEDGAASLNLIAKRAGVGAGTLYRHFPTREDLILAVYQHDVLRLVDQVEDCLKDHPPLDAFRIWLEKLADYVRLKHGLGEALYSVAAQNALNETCAAVTAAVARFLDACGEDGSVRSDLDPADVLQLMGFLWGGGSDEAARTQAQRVLELALNGLRPRLSRQP